VLSAAANIAAHRAFQIARAMIKTRSDRRHFFIALSEIRVQIRFEPHFATEMVLIFFSLGCRFFLDIDAARFYTFFNCSF